MIVHRAYRYRLYPNTTQRAQLECEFGAVRWVYNQGLRARMDYYVTHKSDEHHKNLSYADQCRDLSQLKSQPEFSWLRESNSQTLQQALQDLQTAYLNFFRGTTKFPSFKRKHQKQSFRVPQHFTVGSNFIRVPKIGNVRARIHREVGDKLCSVTISKTPAGKYYASVLCECYVADPTFEGNAIGIDLGIRDYLVDSNGIRVANPKWLQKLLGRLRRLQQILSGKTRGSRNYLRLRLKIARLHEKIQNKRLDFQHKLALQLVRENQTICCETLGVQKMLAESNHVLARHIQDASCYGFLTKLDYKGKWYGCKVIKIDRFFPSSKRCNVCGYINENLTLSDREWCCPECGTNLDRDQNAAKNILAVGTSSSSLTAAGTTVCSDGA